MWDLNPSLCYPGRQVIYFKYVYMPTDIQFVDHIHRKAWKIAILGPMGPLFAPGDPPGEGGKIWKVLIIIREECPHASNVVICVFSSIKWPISIENCKNRLFSYVFYCFQYKMGGKTQTSLSTPLPAGGRVIWWYIFDTHPIGKLWYQYALVAPRRTSRVKIFTLYILEDQTE